MTKKLICPSCNRANYTSSPDAYTPCVYCGLVFSEDSSVGPNKRLESRYYWSTDCQIFEGVNLSPLTAETETIAPNGVGIRYAGRLLVAGKRVTMHIKNPDIETSAIVVWSKTENNLSAVSGLRFLESISLPFVHKKEGLGSTTASH